MIIYLGAKIVVPVDIDIETLYRSTLHPIIQN
jgi:hypothetical protein